LNLLVTGGAGFIGSHVAEALLKSGHRVLVVDDLSTGREENLPAGVMFEKLDVREERLAGLLASFRPELVFHLAAQMDVRRSVADPIFDAGVNILGTLRLAQAVRSTGCKKVIFSSTGGAIYGEQEKFPAPESHPCRPESPYGLSKFCAERYLEYFSRCGGPAFVALRYANVYGPRQNPHGEAGVVAIFCEKMLRGDTPVINGDGRQTRDFVFVGDVVQANLMAMADGVQGVFNIGTGVETDINWLAGELARLCGFSRPVPHGPAKPGEQQRSSVDATLAARMLGWRPKVGLGEGLRLTVDFFRSRLQKAEA
jgi:UDP-glucose 4-epimerase